MAMRINNDQELYEAIQQMKEAKTDLADYEIKDASGGYPHSLVESLVAFSNTTGGVIILGISEHDFSVKKIDLKGLQFKLAQSARNEIVPAIQLDIHVLHYEDKPVIVANVPELPVKEKPCYVKRFGMMDGSYLRTGDGDYKMTMYEIQRFIENERQIARNDIQIVSDATIEDFDPDLLAQWLKVQRSGVFGGSDSLSDEQLLMNRRAIAEDSEGVLRPTITGLMALGAFPQRFFPRLNIVFASYPTIEKGEREQWDRRYVDSVNVDGPIPTMLLGALRAVSRNIKHGAIVKGALREDVPDYPMVAVREAVANALMHRDYSKDVQGNPVRVELYPDRLEIVNPGGLFGPLTVKTLGKSGITQSRNQFLSRILEDVAYTDIDGRTGRVVENRGTGYALIERSLESALMQPPTVLSTLDEFRIIFRHRSMTKEEGPAYSKDNVEQAILTYLAQKGTVSTAQIATAAGLSTKTVREYLNRMLEQGLVEGVGSKFSPQRRYRLADTQGPVDVSVGATFSKGA